jgi:O-antigen ligase
MNTGVLIGISVIIILIIGGNLYYYSECNKNTSDEQKIAGVPVKNLKNYLNILSVVIIFFMWLYCFYVIFNSPKKTNRLIGSDTSTSTPE